MKPVEPDDMKQTVGEATDGRDNLKDMALSIDNMAMLMTQLHEAKALRGAALSVMGTIDRSQKSGFRIFLTATNDVNEEQLARAAVKHLRHFLADLANIGGAVKVLEEALASDTPHENIRAALAMLTPKVTP